MRILLLNPNTTASVTDLVADRVAAVVGDAATFVPVTARFGAAYIASRAAMAIAGHAALEAFAAHGEGCDAVLLACFGDPGLLALREVSPVPVVGMLEASCIEARRTAGRYGIVTGGALWKPMLEEAVAGLGLGDGLAGIRTVERTGGEIAADPEGSLAGLAAACRDCAVEDGAEAVVLGGAALAGLAARLQPHVPVPVLCSVEAGLRASLAAAGAPSPRPAPTPMDTVHLSPPLERLLGRRTGR